TAGPPPPTLQNTTCISGSWAPRGGPPPPPAPPRPATPTPPRTTPQPHPPPAPPSGGGRTATPPPRGRPPGPNPTPTTTRWSAPPRVVNAKGNNGTERDSAPRITISQGTADGRVQPGQVTVVWADTGTFSQVTPIPETRIVSNRVGGLASTSRETLSYPDVDP